MSEQNKELLCIGCSHYSDFPSHIKCHGCSRVYSDHYEADKNNIIQLMFQFTQYEICKDDWHELLGGYFLIDFEYDAEKMVNCNKIEFPLEEVPVPTCLEVKLINPKDNRRIGMYTRRLPTRVQGGIVNPHSYILVYGTEREYALSMIERNSNK